MQIAELRMLNNYNVSRVTIHMLSNYHVLSNYTCWITWRTKQLTISETTGSIEVWLEVTCSGAKWVVGEVAES